MQGGINAVKTVGEYGDGVEVSGQGGAMGVDVDAIGQAADNEYVGQQAGEVGQEVFNDFFAVVGDVAGAYDAEYVTTVERSGAAVKKIERGSLTVSARSKRGYSSLLRGMTRMWWAAQRPVLRRCGRWGC